MGVAAWVGVGDGIAVGAFVSVGSGCVGVVGVGDLLQAARKHNVTNKN